MSNIYSGGARAKIMAQKGKKIRSSAETPCVGCFPESHASERRSPILWSVQFQTMQPMEAFPQLQSIVAERRTDASYRYRGVLRSSEKHCLFKYTLAGEGRFQVGGKKYRLPPGYGFLCRINDPATSYYYPENGRAPWEFVYIAFIGPVATAMTGAFVCRYGPVFQLPPDIGFIPEIMAWRRHDKNETRIVPADGARIIADLFAALAQSKSSADRTDAGFDLVQEARRLMREHLHRFCNVKFLAGQLGVTREHLSRVFKEQTGQSLYRYLQRQKILEACRLLKETRLAQKEISVRMGYNVPAHFTRIFTRIMRMTPSRFRAIGTIPTH